MIPKGKQIDKEKKMMTEREMEEQLVELFEAARKAADAAGLEEEGGAEETRCLDALFQLRSFPITIQALVSHQLGKRLRPLTKHARKNIQDVASEIFTMWKRLFIDQTNIGEDEKDGTWKSTKSIKCMPATVETAKAQKVQRPTSARTVKLEDVSKTQAVKAEKTDYNRASTFKKSVKSEAAVASPVSLPKCDDALRDRIREQIYEALCEVPGEAKEEILVQVSASDPAQVSTSVELALFQKWGRSNGSYKIKYRSLMFNLKDGNNPDFRRKVLLGHIKPEEIVNLRSEEMASDARQLENQHIKDRALFECERGDQRAATTDQFKCGRCGQRKATYHQMQTRSADEPMTTYVTCVNCNHHWKFC